MLFLSAAAWSIFISPCNLLNTSGNAEVNEASTLTEFLYFQFYYFKVQLKEGTRGKSCTEADQVGRERLLSRRVSKRNQQWLLIGGAGKGYHPGSKLLGLRKKDNKVVRTTWNFAAEVLLRVQKAVRNFLIIASMAFQKVWNCPESSLNH